MISGYEKQHLFAKVHPAIVKNLYYGMLGPCRLCI